MECRYLIGDGEWSGCEREEVSSDDSSIQTHEINSHFLSLKAMREAQEIGEDAKVNREFGRATA